MLKAMVGAFKLKEQSQRQKENTAPINNRAKVESNQPQIILDAMEMDKY